MTPDFQFSFGLPTIMQLTSPLVSCVCLSSVVGWWYNKHQGMGRLLAATAALTMAALTNTHLKTFTEAFLMPQQAPKPFVNPTTPPIHTLFSAKVSSPVRKRGW